MSLEGLVLQVNHTIAVTISTSFKNCHFLFCCSMSAIIKVKHTCTPPMSSLVIVLQANHTIAETMGTSFEYLSVYELLKFGPVNAVV